MQFSVLVSFFAAIGAASSSKQALKCKAIPGTPDWPSDIEWKALNTSVGGRLIRPSAPGAVCHPSHAVYNKSECANIANLWTSSDFHAGNPVSFDYNDDTCFPDPDAPCSVGGYASYVIKANCSKDVQVGVNFARQKNVRLIVKGTGHDFNGRSQAPNALSIWTHNMQGLTFHNAFQPANCPSSKSYNAVTIAAGMQWRDVQAAAANRSLVIVGGADPDVGLVGYLTGGGHSPISGTYGLAADQALEFSIVTADGSLLTINECNYPDLFWALRGGGPSFAIVLTITVKTYPTSRTLNYLLSITTTPNSETYWAANAYFHSQLPRLAENGVMGYYYCFPTHSPTNKSDGAILASFLLLNGSKPAVDALFAPLLQHFGQNSYPDPVQTESHVISFPTFFAWFSTNGAAAVGFDGRLGSRLLGDQALTANLTELADALRTSTPKAAVLIGHVVAGKGVREAQPVGGSDAVLPAWRKAYTHVALPATWKLGNYTQKDAVTSQLTLTRVETLRQLAPDSGAYVNEADPDEPDWQLAFWGQNYRRLLAIKRKYDMKGVFYCFPCVGAEDWVVNNGQLCPASGESAVEL